MSVNSDSTPLDDGSNSDAAKAEASTAVGEPMVRDIALVSAEASVTPDTTKTPEKP